MSIEIKNKKLNHAWDSLLSSKQKELVIKPGFGLTQLFPYMAAEDVKELMDQIEQILDGLEEKIKLRYQ